MRSWKQQAEFATTALRDAKNEVLERKKELERTLAEVPQRALQIWP